MSVGTTATSNPEHAWLHQAFAALEKVAGHPLALWTQATADDWYCTTSSLPAGADEELTQLLNKASKHRTPFTVADGPGSYQIIIPLGGAKSTAFGVATTSVETDEPEMLVGLAETCRYYFQQQELVVRLCEENDYFLKQVSDDFEELTFLRSMAEHLCISDSTRKLSELIRTSLPTLGESVSCETLCFIDAATDTPRIAASWHADERVLPIESSLLLQLAATYRDDASVQPVIKNRFDASPDCETFLGVREFALVSIASSMGQIGWLLAVNRWPTHASLGKDMPRWRLSQDEFGSSEASLLNTAGAMIASHANNLSLFREREELLVKVVRTLVFAIDSKDRYTCGHSERVALYAKRLAQQLGYGDDACRLLYLTGLLHDVGKIAVSDAILNKPDRLSDEEFEEIKRHPDEGWKILQELEQLSYVLPGVLHHHERPDGAGYPDGLVGDQIPMDGRVLAVADAYDAMTSDRAYRDGMSQAKAEEILRRGAGTQWDPRVIEAFFEVVPDIVAIRKTYQLPQRPERTRSAGLEEVSD